MNLFYSIIPIKNTKCSHKLIDEGALRCRKTPAVILQWFFVDRIVLRWVINNASDAIRIHVGSALRNSRLRKETKLNVIIVLNRKKTWSFIFVATLSRQWFYECLLRFHESLACGGHCHRSSETGTTIDIICISDQIFL